MSLAIVHFPTAELGAIERLRARHDPQHALVGAHVTIVFPVPDAVGEAALFAHAAAIAARFPPFPLRLRGLARSADDHLFLTAADGRAELIALHDALYTGPLAAHLRAELAFEPHVTLGDFRGAPDRLDAARAEAEHAAIDLRSTVERLDLLAIDDRARAIVARRALVLRG